MEIIQENIAESIKNHNKNLDNYNDKLFDLNMLHSLTNKYYPYEKEFIQMIELDSDIVRLSIKQNLEMISLIQSKCQHKMKYYGDTSHDTINKCIYCDLKEKN